MALPGEDAVTGPQDPGLASNLGELDNIFGANIASQIPENLKYVILEKCLKAPSGGDKSGIYYFCLGN